MLSYKKENIFLAKNLRKNMTPWERKLWYNFLRNYPIRFLRQKCIGNYIVDFYCHKVCLVIELDGGGHYESEQIKRDEQREEYLRNLGLKIIRFSNKDINDNFNGVCQTIDLTVKRILNR